MYNRYAENQNLADYHPVSALFDAAPIANNGMKNSATPKNPDAAPEGGISAGLFERVLSNINPSPWDFVTLGAAYLILRENGDEELFPLAAALLLLGAVK